MNAMLSANNSMPPINCCLVECFQNTTQHNENIVFLWKKLSQHLSKNQLFTFFFFFLNLNSLYELFEFSNNFIEIVVFWEIDTSVLIAPKKGCKYVLRSYVSPHIPRFTVVLFKEHSFFYSFLVCKSIFVIFPFWGIIFLWI